MKPGLSNRPGSLFFGTSDEHLHTDRMGVNEGFPFRNYFCGRIALFESGLRARCQPSPSHSHFSLMGKVKSNPFCSISIFTWVTALVPFSSISIFSMENPFRLTLVSYTKESLGTVSLYESVVRAYRASPSAFILASHACVTLFSRDSSLPPGNMRRTPQQM